MHNNMKHHYSKQMQNFGAQHPAFNYWHNTMRRRVRVYDNAGRTVDRFTVIIKRTLGGFPVFDLYTMSADPMHAQGVNLYSHTSEDYEKYKPSADETRVQVQDLPLEVIQAIEERIG